jgi:hypothetical protein
VRETANKADQANNMDIKAILFDHHLFSVFKVGYQFQSRITSMSNERVRTGKIAGKQI